MIRKVIKHEGYKIHIEYLKYGQGVSKNDLPIRTINIHSSTYALCCWYSIKKDENNRFIPSYNRNNDLPCYMTGYTQEYRNYDNRYKYNGYALFGNWMNENEFKFIRGVCLEQLKKELDND